MDWRTLCKMKFILSLLCMRIVASSEQYKHTKSCIKRLEENNRAYNASKKTAQYSIFRPTGNSLSFQEIVESYQAVNNRLASKTMLTIITIRKRNRNIPDDKNANMSSFITALQKYNTDKKAISFVVNNMIVTINTVEQSYLPGLCMIRNTSEQIRQAYVKLNLIFIDTLPELLFKTYVSLMINWIHFYGRVMSEDLKLDGKNAEDRIKAIDTCYDNNYKREFNNMKNNLFRMFVHDDIADSLYSCASVIDSIHLSLQLFEKNYGFAYLTKHKKDFIKSIRYLIHKRYNSLLLEFMNEIFKTGFSTMENPVHEQESRNAFKRTRMLFVADMGQEKPESLSGSSESSESESTESLKSMSSVDEFKERTVYSIYQVYFERIGFDSLQASFLKSKKEDFERLRKRLAYQDSTKIVIEGKYSNDDVYSLCSALDSANAFSELDKCQALYLYKEKPIEVGSDDDGAHECEINKLSTDANTAKSVLADGTHKTNAIDTAQECGDKSAIQRKYSLVISVVKKNVFYSEQGALRIVPCKEQSAIETANSTDSMPEEVKKLLSRCLDKSNRKSTELCEITVESKHFVSHVHILNYISIDEKEITSLIYDIQYKGQMTKGTSKENLGRSLICLDDVPTVFLENVLNDIWKLQLTGATEFKPSNILTVGCQRIIHNKKDLWFRELDKMESLVPRIIGFLDTSRTQNHFSDQFKISHLDMTNETFASHMDDTRAYLRELEFDNNVIDTIISQVKQNIDFEQKESNDPCVISRHESDIYIECYTTCEPDRSMILYICASQKNESMGTSVDFAIKTLENVLNNEKNKVMIETVDLIEKQMMLKQKIIPTIIVNLCRQKNFDVSLTRTRSKWEKLCLTKIGHNIESLFGYSDEWAKANGSNDRFSGKLDFNARLKSLIEPRIEEIVKAIFDAKYELNNQALVILSFKICKGATLGGSNALVDDASCKNDVIYASLKHLEASEEHFTKNKDGIYKCL